MGMYDTIYVKKEDPRLTCLNGHSITELQTKDLDRDLDLYRLTPNNRIVMFDCRSQPDRVGPLEGDWYLDTIGSCGKCLDTHGTVYDEFTLVIRAGVLTEVRRIERPKDA